MNKLEAILIKIKSKYRHRRTLMKIRGECTKRVFGLCVQRSNYAKKGSLSEKELNSFIKNQ